MNHMEYSKKKFQVNECLKIRTRFSRFFHPDCRVRLWDPYSKLEHEEQRERDQTKKSKIIKIAYAEKELKTSLILKAKKWISSLFIQNKPVIMEIEILNEEAACNS